MYLMFILIEYHSGKISWLKYVPGTFLNASLDKSSEDNERMIIKIEYSKNKYVYVVQIAGLIARRIKCDLSENQSVTIGDRFGLIRFGSRVDLYFLMIVIHWFQDKLLFQEKQY